jgi:hypothetical protein
MPFVQLASFQRNVFLNGSVFRIWHRPRLLAAASAASAASAAYSRVFQQ